ncbi:unnamed protein product [Trifolium pratense]|uniref:Uncharacterized protein n=1 Tax=Trifolium pratense TaxID=57577 RepID=A0ACB0IQT3_TRIPR|nr:unnamed protein product [Trifolium pratense]
MNQIAVVHPEPRPNVSTIQQPEMPTHEPTPEATESRNEFQQPDPALPIDNVIRIPITATIEGLSVCPGEPSETSMPKMRAEACDTIGIHLESSLADGEFIPPR